MTAYFAEKLLERGIHEDKSLVVSWGTNCKSNKRDVSHLDSTHEEADPKLILHALEATQSGATAITVHTPDTDVMVLSSYVGTNYYVRIHHLLLALVRATVP